MVLEMSTVCKLSLVTIALLQRSACIAPHFLRMMTILTNTSSPELQYSINASFREQQYFNPEIQRPSADFEA
jgi:hypothetical protein